LKIIICPW